MFDFFRALFGTDFMPHLYCLRNDPTVLWLQVISDLAIAAAYFTIPLILFHVVLKRKDLLFRRAALLFAIFIAASGATHVLSVWTIWIPVYRLEAVMKAVTALASVTTAVVLLRERPPIVGLPGIAQLEEEIRGREQAEAEARDKEVRFRAFVDSVEDYAIYMLSPEGIVLTWNNGAQRLKGYASEEVVGKSFSIFFTEEERTSGHPQEILRLARERGGYEGEGWRVRKDESQFLANVHVRPVYEDGEFRGFSKVTRDLTESRKAEEKYRMLMEAAPDALLIVSRAGDIEYINARGEKLFGYGREEVLGQSVDIFNPERVREMQAIYRNRIFSGSGRAEGGADPELWGLRKDGSEFPLEFTLTPLDTRDGRAFLFVLRDITERRKTEARLQALLEAAPDGLFIVDRQSRIIYMNRRAEEVFGVSRAEVVGKPVDVLIPERLRAERAREREALFLAPEGSQPGYGGEYTGLRGDGSEFPMEASGSPLETADGIVILTSVRDITERKRMEARFQAVVAAVPDAILMVDAEGRIQFANHRAEAMYGRTREEMLGQLVDILLPERIREERRAYRGRLLSGSLVHTPPGLGGEAFAIRKNGEEFPTELSFTPLETGEGKMLLIAIRDITERRKSEARFRALLDSAPDAMVIVSAAGVVELANFQTEMLFGYTKRDLVGQSVDILVPAGLRAEHGSHRAGAFEDPKHREMGRGLDLMAVHKDGRQFPVEISLSPLEGPDGVSVTAAIRDVTDRKKAEMRFRALLESAPDAMVIANGEGVIELANLQTERLFGYPRMELVGQSVDVLVPKNLRADHIAHRARFFADPRPREMGVGLDLMAVRKDGTQFPVEISLSPLDGADGISVTAAIRDVSERKRAEQQLSEKMNELRQSNEALEQFAHIASHDLQEPLRMVGSYTQLLQRRYKGKLDADADEFIGYAVDGTQRMKRLIEDLLVYSRAGRSAPAAKQLRSEDSLREALGNLKAAIEESGAKVTWDALPKVTAAELQLVQLFQNLVGNAIKYRGERVPRIHVAAQSTALEWIFSVADNGIGIEAKYFDRIFVIFQRLHGRGEYEGTGIGLAICKRILQQQGGRIWVESEPGVGSTFYFALPVR